MNEPLKMASARRAAYQPYSHFTAQSRTVTALFSMYGELERAGDREIDLTPLVVFLAFSVESYLNSIGARKVAIWDELERLPWRKKATILHKAVNQIPDWGQDPLQFAIEIFDLRDRLAHGKPETVFGPVLDDSQEVLKYQLKDGLQPEWYAGITKEWVLHAKERLHCLMTYLGGLFGLHESDYLLANTGGIVTDDGQGPDRLISGRPPVGGLSFGE
jgi:hypothetical protein